jgi:hypothetical protein
VAGVILKALSTAAAAVEQAAEESPQMIAGACEAADDHELHTLINMVIEVGPGRCCPPVGRFRYIAWEKCPYTFSGKASALHAGKRAPG